MHEQQLLHTEVIERIFFTSVFVNTLAEIKKIAHYTRIFNFFLSNLKDSHCAISVSFSIVTKRCVGKYPKIEFYSCVKVMKKKNCIFLLLSLKKKKKEKITSIIIFPVNYTHACPTNPETAQSRDALSTRFVRHSTSLFGQIWSHRKNVEGWCGQGRDLSSLRCSLIVFEEKYIFFFTTESLIIRQGQCR